MRLSASREVQAGRVCGAHARGPVAGADLTAGQACPGNVWCTASTLLPSGSRRNVP